MRVAVDGSGNIYIADAGNQRVVKETLSAGVYTQSVVASSGLNGPSGVAVDGSGNVHIADVFNNRVLKETLSAGGYTESTVESSSLNAPMELRRQWKYLYL
jgi:DNA-binding beta-propeller fold protein YncE